MGYQVCVVCHSTSNDLTLNFHKFPGNQIRRQAWIKACKLNEANLKQSSVICSKHFHDNDYNQNIFSRRKLHTEAVPFLVEVVKENVAPNQPLLREFASDPLGNSETNVVMEKNDKILSLPRYVGDLTVEHFSTPRKAKQNLAFVYRKTSEDRKKMKTILQENRRLKKCIASVKDLFELLLEREYLSDEASAAVIACSRRFKSLTEIIVKEEFSE